MYKIIRFYWNQNKENKTIKEGLTLKEAQEYCQREDTRQAGIYFDGYTRE